jgi:hypothetical protein
MVRTKTHFPRRQGNKSARARSPPEVRTGRRTREPRIAAVITRAKELADMR